jgi:4-diphosphocytidyl-2-C-methyl-D-erythritol kinase
MITFHAPAKINLGLQVLGKRPDGFHAIHSLFFHVHGLTDILTLEPSDELTLSCEPEMDIIQEANHAWQAASALRTYSGTTKGAHIHLKKRIPMGAGMGGGSSDAAAVLHHLQDFWQLDIEAQELMKLAATIGSDVPFFMQSKPALIEGRGENLYPFDFECSWWIVLVHPKIHIPTPWAYRQLGLDTQMKEKVGFLELLFQCKQDPYSMQNYFFNDFESVVFDQYPMLQALKDTLYDHGACISLMSGSGSSVFGLFTSEEDAVQAASHLLHFQPVIAPFCP